MTDGIEAIRAERDRALELLREARETERRLRAGKAILRDRLRRMPSTFLERIQEAVAERDEARARIAELEDALRTKDALFRTLAARGVQWAERAKAAEAVLRELAVESDHHDEDCPVNDWYERGDWPPNYVACLCRLAPWTKGETDD